MFALAAIAAAALAVSGQTYFNRVFPQDKGPATLDVSGYPPAIQRDYKIFARGLLALPHPRPAAQHNHE
jgi:hypothetical protein